MLANPDDISSAFSKWGKSTTSEPKKIEAKSEPLPIKARLNFQAVGVCPYCSTPMGRVECCGQEVFFCEPDRFVAPLPNEELPA